MTNHEQYHLLDQDIKAMSWGNLDSDWTPPQSFPDLSQYETVGIDLETKDPNLLTLGPGWTRKDGHVIGIAVMQRGKVLGISLSHTTLATCQKILFTSG